MGKMIFTAGQIPVNPGSGTIEEAEVTGQTMRVMENLAAILKAAGAGLEDVVKTTVFLKEMRDFDEMNAIYGKYLSHRPARTTVAVSALPKDALVEIECVALAHESHEGK